MIFGRSSWTRDRPFARSLWHRRAQHRKTRIYSQVSSGIRAHDPSVRAVKNHLNIMCCFVLCYAMLRYFMLCYVMLCYVMLCYVMNQFILQG